MHALHVYPEGTNGLYRDQTTDVDEALECLARLGHRDSN